MQSPTSRVLACKHNPQGLRSGTFLDTLRLFSERERISGNAALRSSRSACERFWGRSRPSSFGCLAAPFAFA